MKAAYIAELLFSHECVIVPGMGGFLTSYMPAQISKESNRFYPPSCKLAFNARLTDNDGILANHISRTCAISYKEALADIRKWVDDTFKLLYTGEKLILEEIGVLVLNAEGNLQFEPELNINFLGNSFGLPSFVAQSINRGPATATVEKHSRIQPWPLKLKNLIPETLKWAAVLAPFIALTLWGSINSSTISNYFHNYTGFYSWVRTTPGKTSTLTERPKEFPSIRLMEQQKVSPASILNEALISYSPSIISYASLRNQMISEATPENTPPVINDITDCHYFIIGGAFREHSNALKMLVELKAKGYPAGIVDTTGSGMYVVSIKGFSRKSGAAEELPAIKGAGYSSAWIMHKG